MKKKKLALLLAVAMSVTSIDSTAMMVNAADFTSEEVQEQSVELTDEPSEAAEETDAETEDGGGFFRQLIRSCFQRIHPKMKA